MTAESYPIYKSLWESLDAVLVEKGRKLALDIAKELKVPHKPLLDALRNNPERTKFCILSDEETAQHQCQALKHHGAALLRCRQPTLGFEPRYCREHEKYSMDVPRGLQTVRRVTGAEDTYLLSEGKVYTRNGIRCGVMKGADVLVLYEIDES